MNKQNKNTIKYLAFRDWSKANDFSTRSLLKEIREIGSLEQFLDIKFNDLFESKIDLFGEKKPKHNVHELDKYILKYNIIFKEKEIFSIPIEDFPKYKLFENMGVESVVMYLRGQENNIKSILSFDVDQSFGVVGSRKTPEIYSKWLKERMPNKKIAVSGLANGADLIGHREAIKNNKKIVVFPGFNIDWMPPKKKMDVFSEALSNGFVASSIPPLAHFSPGMLQKRNGEMARLTSEGYVLYINGSSGTYGYIKNMVKEGKKVFLPKNIYKDNIQFARNELASDKNYSLLEVL